MAESVDGLDADPSLLLLDQANVIEPEASLIFASVALVALAQDRSNCSRKRLLLCQQ